MVKTTVYLPEDLKYALERVAASRGESEAEVIRVAVRTLVEAEPAPRRPRGGFIHGGDPGLSERVDEALVGFGEH